MSEPHAASGATAARDGRRWVFVALWLLTSGGLGWQLLRGSPDFEQAATLPALLALFACTIALWRCLPDLPIAAESGRDRTRYRQFLPSIAIVTGALFSLRTLIGPPLLFGLPIVALLTLALLRSKRVAREVRYAGSLALVAGVAGLGAGWIAFVSATTWALLQVALVLPGLLAGWSILDRTGLAQAGLGESFFLRGGSVLALRGFVRGALIGLPWALMNVLLGGNHDPWVRSWWQPLVAIQPGIAEEAWGRVLLVPLLFLLLRQSGRARAALLAAVLIAGYWFAYLHTPGGLAAVPSTILIGTLYSLPLSALWLRDGLETAIGFHFWQDFVRFGAAYLLNQGLWPT